MNAISTTQKRLAFFCAPTRTRVNWIDLDQTGQPPRIVTSLDGVQVHGAYELVSLDDAPLAVYRFDSDELAPDYDRDALSALAELVRVVNGMPNVSVDVDEQMRQPREQLRATVENAEEMISNRDAQIDYDEHRIEKIIESARDWKQRAQQRKIYVEHYQEQERTLRAEISDLEDKLRVARNAVDRAVNRSNHSNEHVDRARQEAASLRQQLGQATAEAHDLRERIVEVQANALDTINRVAAALPAPVIDAEVVTPDVVVDTWFGEDNVPVVQIDTECGHGRLRINLNDGIVWDGDPETDDRPGAHAARHPWENITTRAERDLTSTISRQLDTIRDQAEKIERLENERDELVQALKNRNGEGGPSDPGAHGWAIPRYGMLDVWMALHGSDTSTAFEEFYDEHGYADAWSEILGAIRTIHQRIETHRLDAKKFMEERNEAARNLSQASAERAEAWRDLDAARKLGEQAAESFDKAKAEMLDEIRTLRIDRDNARADAEKLREINELQRRGIDESERSRREALRLRDEAQQSMRAYITAAADSEEMRKRLDEQLATERRAYETTSAALRAMIRERDAVLDVAERAMYPHAHGETKSRLIGEYRDARGRLPRLEPEADARDGGLVDVIRQYEGLAQIGANLARAVDDHIADPIMPNAMNIAGLSKMYQREHAKLKR